MKVKALVDFGGQYAMIKGSEADIPDNAVTRGLIDGGFIREIVEEPAKEAAKEVTEEPAKEATEEVTEEPKSKPKRVRKSKSKE